MAAKYRVGVIGHTGRGNYGHGLDTVWLSMPQTQIVGVADPDEEGRGKAAKRPGERSSAQSPGYPNGETRPSH